MNAWEWEMGFDFECKIDSIIENKGRGEKGKGKRELNG